MISNLKHLWARNLFYKYVRANRYPMKEGIRFDKKIKQLQDSHSGDSCIIVGNGPSLTVEDLTKIHEKGVASFAANSIYKLYKETDWRPTYHCFQDLQIIEGLVNKFPSLINETRGFFIRRDAYRRVPIEIIKHPKTYMPKVVMHIRKDSMFDFSEDASRFLSDGTTVTYFMMQLAYYLGFRTIYLIGIDHKFPVLFDKNDQIIKQEDIKLHAFEDDKTVNLFPSRALEATNAYISAKIFYDSHGAKCFNATRGGNLEVFERITLEEALQAYE